MSKKGDLDIAFEQVGEVFLSVQKARVALVGALSGAAVALQGLIESPSSVHEAIGGLSVDDLPTPTPGDSPAVAAAQLEEVIVKAARQCLPDTKIMEQRRRAIGMLFRLAKTLKSTPRPKTTERKPRDTPAPPRKV